MGNCMETWATTQEEEEMQGREGPDVHVKEEACDDSGVRMKILLTREELEWLLLQLKENGEKAVEELLMEMGRERGRVGRGKAKGWKPSLESIMECPEVQSLHMAA